MPSLHWPALTTDHRPALRLCVCASAFPFRLPARAPAQVRMLCADAPPSDAPAAGGGGGGGEYVSPGAHSGGGGDAGDGEDDDGQALLERARRLCQASW